MLTFSCKLVVKAACWTLQKYITRTTATNKYIFSTDRYYNHPLKRILAAVNTGYYDYQQTCKPKTTQLPNEVMKRPYCFILRHWLNSSILGVSLEACTVRVWRCKLWM